MNARPSLRLFPALLTAAVLLAPRLLPAQVFTVGLKTATDDVITDFHPTHVPLSGEGLDERGRLDLLRNLEAEQGFAHRQLPFGSGLILIANGNMVPANDDYKKMLYEKGQSAAPGDRLQISKLDFKADRIIIDFNGGPFAKHRFLSHIAINDNPIAIEGPIATGCRITLIFEGGIPQISAAEIKSLLDPLVDFKARSSVEAYTNTLSPKVREAVQAHEVLVGMDRRMVLAALGAPLTKHREHTAADPNSPYFEEWLYGTTPQPIQFVRFRNGRVVRLEIAELGKPVVVRDQNELGEAAAPALLARTIANGDEVAKPGEGRSARPPTLRRPGEVLDSPSTVDKVNMPPDPPKLLSSSPQP